MKYKKLVALAIAGILVCNMVPGMGVPVLATETDDAETELEIEEISEGVIAVTVNEALDAVLVEDSMDMEDVAAGIEYALDESDEAVSLDATMGIVIALDPGHDASHAGAEGNNIHEEVATLKIAQYCKEELETYAGVSVYMTREDAACPYPDTVNKKGGNLLDIDERVNASAEQNAAAYVSIHLNSSDSTAANGSEVYYHKDDDKGEGLSDSILGQLVSLGLKNRGSKENAGYRVILDADKAGFPGIIVEHAFVSNSSDASKYLSTDEKLKQLGIADATGIANHYGLKKNARWVYEDKNTGEWICHYNDKPEYTFQGLANSDKGWLYIVDGIADFTYSGLVRNEFGWWVVKDGIVDFQYNGFAENPYGWWCIKNGKVDFSVNDVMKGTVNDETAWWYVSGGQVQFADTVAKNEYAWWCIKNGKVDFNFTGIAKNNYGWWRIENGQVNFKYQGFVENPYGWWYLKDGKVQFGTNDVLKGTVKGETAWWYISNGQVLFTDTVARNANGWWCIRNGKVDFGFTGIAKNSSGWWRIQNGQVNFKYEGFVENPYGWWYLKNGKVQFGTNDVMKGTVDGETAWWYVSGGQVKFVDSVEKNSNGWWRIENGKVNFSFHGAAENAYGVWYLKNGKVDFTYNGTVMYQNELCEVKNGAVQVPEKPELPDDMEEAEETEETEEM